MDYTIIKCPACDNFYDEDFHLPKALNCGHTVCYSCIDNLDHYDLPFCCIAQASAVDKNKLNTNSLVLEYIKKIQQVHTISSEEDAYQFQVKQSQKQRPFTPQKQKDSYYKMQSDTSPQQQQQQKNTSHIQQTFRQQQNETIQMQTENMQQITQNVVSLAKDLETEKQTYISSIEKRIEGIEHLLLNKKDDPSGQISLIVQEKNQHIINLENQLQKSNEEIQKKNRKNSNLKSQVLDKTRECEQYQTMCQNIDQKISILEHENQDLKQQNQKFKQQISRLNQEITTKDSGCQSMEIRLKNTEKDAKKWQEKLNLIKDQQWLESEKHRNLLIEQDEYIQQLELKLIQLQNQNELFEQKLKIYDQERKNEDDFKRNTPLKKLKEAQTKETEMFQKEIQEKNEQLISADKVIKELKFQKEKFQQKSLRVEKELKKQYEVNQEMLQKQQHFNLQDQNIQIKALKEDLQNSKVQTQGAQQDIKQLKQIITQFEENKLKSDQYILKLEREIENAQKLGENMRASESLEAQVLKLNTENRILRDQLSDANEKCQCKQIDEEFQILLQFLHEINHTVTKGRPSSFASEYLSGSTNEDRDISILSKIQMAVIQLKSILSILKERQFEEMDYTTKRKPQIYQQERI